MRRRGGRWRLIAALALLASLRPDPVAALQWYTIELIGFVHDGGIATEHWPLDPGAPELAGSIEPGRELDLGSGAGPRAQASGASDEPLASTLPHAFRLLGGAELTLHGARRRLERSAGYRPLLHLGWRQPGFDAGESRAVHVGSGDAGGESIDGTVRVWRARYLHVDVDFLYRIGGIGPPAGPATVPASGGVAEAGADAVGFRMRAQRRMRSGELHHLDHPAFGLLVLIVPYEVPAAAGTPGPAAPPGAAERVGPPPGPVPPARAQTTPRPP